MVLIFRPTGREAADHGDQGEIPDWGEVAIFFQNIQKTDY